MRGRKPKATHLHALEGTRPSAPRIGEPQAAGEVGVPPAHFTQPQRDLWQFYAASAPAGLLKAVDRNVFETFIASADMVRQCAEILSREGLVVATERGTVEHPASRALARFSGIMLKAASECGFSPASRPRISVRPEEPANPFAAFARQDSSRRVN